MYTTEIHTRASIFYDLRPIRPDGTDNQRLRLYIAPACPNPLRDTSGAKAASLALSQWITLHVTNSQRPKRSGPKALGSAPATTTTATNTPDDARRQGMAVTTAATTTTTPVMIDEDWEEWSPEKGSFLHHMMAGSAAGVAEHVSIFPIDTIKCQRCPVNGKPLKLSAIQTARNLVAEEGPLRLFRGVSTMLSASLPAHAVYFSVFEAMKKTLGADTAEHTPVASGAAGVVATVCHDMIMTPMDVVKQRLQLGYYSGVMDCFKTIIRQEGLRALYLSFPTTFIMNLPYSMIMVSANETFKKILNPSGEMNITAYVASGAMAGAMAGVLTNPLDVAKTRLQTQMMLVQEDTSVRSRVAPAAATATVSSCPLLLGSIRLHTACDVVVDPQCPSRSHCAQLQSRGRWRAEDARAVPWSPGRARADQGAGRAARLLPRRVPSAARARAVRRRVVDNVRSTKEDARPVGRQLTRLWRQRRRHLLDATPAAVTVTVQTVSAHGASERRAKSSIARSRREKVRSARERAGEPPVARSSRRGTGMRTLSFTRRKAPAEVAGFDSQDAGAVTPTPAAVDSSTVALERDGKEPPLIAAQAAAEESCQSLRVATIPTPDPHSPACAPKGSTLSAPLPMSRLRRMMRSQSDEHLREPALVEAAPAKDEAASVQCSEAAQGADLDPALPAACPDASSASSPANQTAVPERDAAAAPASDVFLNASIQLLHAQSDVRQRIRQIWFTIQRLRWEGQVSDAGVELLHTELLAVMKSFSFERLDGARHLKTGCLTLLQAPDATGWLRPAKSLFGGSGGRRLGQRMWCTLSEEYGKLELTPMREESAVEAAHQRGGSDTSPPAGESASASPLAGFSNKLKLPTSLSRLLGDALQPAPVAEVPEQTRVLKLHGCQVRKVPTASTKALARAFEAGSEPGGAASSLEVRHQIQVLVPNAAAQRTGAASSQSSYSIYAFEVSDTDGGEDETESWTCALDRVCMHHLYVLERALRSVRSLGQYRDVLAQHFPLCISLSWLRNRIDRYEPFVIKDLERDKVLVDQKLIATAADRGDDSESHGPEQGTVSEVVKYVVTRVMDFVRRVEQRAKSERASVSAALVPSDALESPNRHEAAAFSTSASATPPLPRTPTTPQTPTSGLATNRFTKCAEARALAFVERVLRGSSRTQSGGDIYDAITFFCQHSRVSICPVSQDACPVQMNIVSDDASELFQVEVHVRMRFKVVEMAPMAAATPPPAPASPLVNGVSSSAFHRSLGVVLVDTSADTTAPRSLDDRNAGGAFSDELFHETTAGFTTPTFTGTRINDGAALEGPKEWAVLEGTLTRQFTLGKLSEPGAVTIAYIAHDATNLTG
ncbi:hypothetical protein PybrP1_010192 [[Pythium] brassicae (nom. inval.)]|nr:hypothetical protein PybrP1_010192 [[Pythium] brassicae (nom. inval.)]